MKGITIRDIDAERGVLAFDLRDILEILGEKGLVSVWTAVGVEVASGVSAARMEALADEQETIIGNELQHLAKTVNQVIDGEFKGTLPGGTAPWIVVRAVDSSAYDVETDDEQLLSEIRSRFRVVEDIPQSPLN